MYAITLNFLRYYLVSVYVLFIFNIKLQTFYCSQCNNIDNKKYC